MPGRPIRHWTAAEPPLRQRRWRRERGSNRRSLRERVGPLRPKGNAVVVKRGSLVSPVSDAGDRGFKSFSRYPIGPLETPYFTPFLKSGETSLVTGFSNKKPYAVGKEMFRRFLLWTAKQHDKDLLSSCS